MVVWVQFPPFPVHFYHKEILFSLGNMLGRAIKLDYHTLHQQRAKFARIAVEIDLSKPLVTRIRLDGQWQYVEYENLPTVCFECGRIGHLGESCPSLTPPVQLITAGPLTNSSETSGNEEAEERTGYDPWMQVTRRSRRGNRGTENGNSNKKMGDSQISGGVGKGKNN
ncbi:unnamed protein product [Linum tenue]|uniref:CCHC-type domain-containing protein n=1 Tax=Linum tenue TaxID=586396 RepID=A0AAV0IXZ5_9ROSI|nr:unnamed protein product [Linum tenue]